MNASAFRFAVVLSAIAAVTLSVRAAEQEPAGPQPSLLYVATDGNDAWSGTLPEPNGQKTDGPFATLERARDEIRKLKKQGRLPLGGAVVEIRGG